jgi:hypothetical protein
MAVSRVALRSDGFTLTEVMIAGLIMTVAFLGMTGGFMYIARGSQQSNTKTLASNLAQEQIGLLKTRSYYRIMATTSSASDSSFSPNMVYDKGYYPPEKIQVEGQIFERRTYVRKVTQNATGGMEYLSWNSPDHGLKEIAVYVVWQDKGRWRKLEMASLEQNPRRATMSARIEGTARRGGTPLANVRVVPLEKTSQAGLSVSPTGKYNFWIEPGTYTLHASLSGYWPQTRPPVFAPAGSPVTGQDFNLAWMQRGHISGSAFLRDHLVISEVCAGVGTDDVEYIELYNPTTWTWRVNSANIGLQVAAGGSSTVTDLTLTGSADVDSHHYCLIGTDSLGAPIKYGAIQRITAGQGGAVILLDKATGARLDSVAWGSSNSTKPPPLGGVGAEGSAFRPTTMNPSATNVGGLTLNQSIERKATRLSDRDSMHGAEISAGNAWDRNSNNLDWVHNDHGHADASSHGDYSPLQSILNSETPLAGTPARGAVVFAKDGLSGPAVANANGDFTLTNVTTGTWNVYITSDSVRKVTPSTTVANGVITPSGPHGLDETSFQGYITGTVKDFTGAPLNGIVVSAAGNSLPTSADGTYFLEAPPGVTDVVANPGQIDPSYLEASINGVQVDLGRVKKLPDIVLQTGGAIIGTVVNAGLGDPLANMVVVASDSVSGVEKGSVLTQTDGTFRIDRLPPGTYIVSPVLEDPENESSTPLSQSVPVSSFGGPFSAGTFTIGGATGYIEGTVRRNGKPITTGVLLYARESPIGLNPPDMPPSGGGPQYFGATSDAEGRFKIAVRGQVSPKYNVYAWYWEWQGNAMVPLPRKAYEGGTAVQVQPGQTVTRNFDW